MTQQKVGQVCYPIYRLMGLAAQRLLRFIHFGFNLKRTNIGQINHTCKIYWICPYPPLFRLELIRTSCQNGELILTPNQRLRAKAIEAWGLEQQSLGAGVWQAPRIYTLEQWFDQCWQQLQARAYQPSLKSIVTPQQQRALWEAITANSGFMQPEVLAQQAAEGLQRLQLWQLPLESLSRYTGAKSATGILGIELYQYWCKTYYKKLEEPMLNHLRGQLSHYWASLHFGFTA